MLLHRAQAARADEDPRVPRRSARHGDRRGRGRAQRARDRRQGHRQGEARLLRGWCRRARVPRPPGEPRPRSEEGLRARQQGRRPQGPH
jgi:hypothetical protein